MDGRREKGSAGSHEAGGRQDSERLGQCQRRRQKGSRRSQASIEEPPAKSGGRRSGYRVLSSRNALTGNPRSGDGAGGFPGGLQKYTGIARIQNLNYSVRLQVVFPNTAPKAGCAATRTRHAPCFFFRVSLKAPKVLNLFRLLDVYTTP